MFPDFGDTDFHIHYIYNGARLPRLEPVVVTNAKMHK